MVQAVGEPPLFLASSIFFAIKEAISAARSDSGLNEYFYLESPATAARIRMACQDNITRKVPIFLTLFITIYSRFLLIISYIFLIVCSSKGRFVYTLERCAINIKVTKI